MNSSTTVMTRETVIMRIEAVFRDNPFSFLASVVCISFYLLGYLMEPARLRRRMFVQNYLPAGSLAGGFDDTIDHKNILYQILLLCSRNLPEDPVTVLLFRAGLFLFFVESLMLGSGME